MKDNVVAFPGKRFDPINSVFFLLSHELPLLEAISTVMAQITAKYELTEEELGDIWLMLYEKFLINHFEK
ncbi:hypothetical protein [Bacillus benzoevorans]|uniref:PqqD family protein n=1 Tax=Bacillus benzoevorans TaxID=1456 RepID=A0A7X0HWY4_9BACI|nr:hypothetical protein [Bacillus benzoevorans]MBB6447125.1 hypothetical protein [Bacillus benzoevorans]